MTITCESSPSDMRRPRSRRGVALVAVLWIGLLAGLLLIGLRGGSSVNLALAHNELEAVQAHWLARAGVEQALAILANDAADVDSSLDLWFSNAQAFRKVDLGVGTYSVTAPPAPGHAPTDVRFGVIDLSGRLNVNHATAHQLKALPLSDMTPAVAASILDWRDRNRKTRAGGAEGGYYANLTFPYEIRNGPFQTLDELRLVKDVSSELFLGEDVNRNGVLDFNENDYAAHPPRDDGDGELDRGLAGLTTAYTYERNQTGLGLERVNVNEAGRRELQAQLNFSRALAQAVVEQRREDEFESLMDLLEVEPQRDGGGGGDDKRQGDSARKVTRITLDWLAANLDALTLTNNERLPPRINVNTAAKAVLITLPDITREAAQRIIDYRQSQGGPFNSVGELWTSGSVGKDLFKEIAEEVTVRSNVFKIRSVGVTPRGVRRQIVVVVDRHADPLRILYWYQSQ